MPFRKMTRRAASPCPLQRRIPCIPLPTPRSKNKQRREPSAVRVSPPLRKAFSFCQLPSPSLVAETKQKKRTPGSVNKSRSITFVVCDPSFVVARQYDDGVSRGTSPQVPKRISATQRSGTDGGPTKRFQESRVIHQEPFSLSFPLLFFLLFGSTDRLENIRIFPFQGPVGNGTFLCVKNSNPFLASYVPYLLQGATSELSPTWNVKTLMEYPGHC